MSNTKTRHIRVALMAACASVSLVPGAANAQQAQRISYNLPAQDLWHGADRVGAAEWSRDLLFR